MNSKLQDIRAATTLGLSLAIVAACSAPSASTSQVGVAPLCRASTLSIPEIQGTAAASGHVGELLTVQGVVTGDFRGKDALDGFFLQDSEGDGRPATSDGIFVHAPEASDIAVGDIVAVRGEVTEFHGLTEIARTEAIAVCGTASEITATEIELGADLEAFEGMLVSLPQALTLVEHHDLGRYGQVTVAAAGRLFKSSEPSATLVIDDGSLRKDPRPVPLLTQPGNLRLGASVSGLTGIVAYHHDLWVLHPTRAPRFISPPRPLEPPQVGGDLRVASFNLYNYFTTFDERGAASSDELELQSEKLVVALVALDADLIALAELENNGPRALDDLLARLNRRAPRAYVSVADPPGGLGEDEIRVGLIYRPGHLRPVGPARSDGDAAFMGRSPLAQVFDVGGQRLGVLVAHFKSKSCRDATDLDLDQNDGQGCWNATRVAQARRTLALAGRLETEALLLLGDLNAYADEDPIRTLISGGLIDQVAARLPIAERYSFVYRGRSGYLDYVLTSVALAARVSGIGFWHINADEPRVHDYRSDLATSDPYRSSDHDPLLLGLDF